MNQLLSAPHRTCAERVPCGWYGCDVHL